MVFEGSELIGPLLKAFFAVFLSGIMSLAFAPQRIKFCVSIIIVFLIALITSTLAICVFSTGSIEYIINGGSFFGRIPIRIDSLSAWFILIINITTLMGVLYGSGYLKSSSCGAERITFHWILYLVFHSSMILVSIVQHSLIFLVLWELMSLSSLLLVLFDYTNPGVIKAGINYLIQMHLSVIFLTIAFIWVFVKTGTFDFDGISAFFGSNANIWLFLIFFTGFGFKAGFMGLHTWLPQAHPAAPSHVSGVMSGVIVKMGIYGILRVITYLKTEFILIGDIVISISVVTGLFGIMNAAVHRDFKKMLAYCTIENIGIIGVGIGIGLTGIGRQQSMLIFLGFGGALLHVLNHSLYKSLLFFSAGSVYRQTHTRNMDRLGGLIKKMPQTAGLFLAGSIAIGGIPPFNGFISEFLVYFGLIQAIGSADISQITLMMLSFAGISLIGGVSLLAFTKAFGTIFLGSPRQTLDQDATEVSGLMLLPQYLIVIMMFSIAFFPSFFINLTGKILCDNTSYGFNFDSSGLSEILDTMRKISFASFLFLSITGLLYFLKHVFLNRTRDKVGTTWGCAYIAPSSRMQHTGKSYSKTFSKLFNFIIIERKFNAEIGNKEIFPAPQKYRSFYMDVFDSKFIGPAIGLINRFINLFQFIQNGKIQTYVIYGIIFIMIIFIGTVLNLLH